MLKNRSITLFLSLFFLLALAACTGLSEVTGAGSDLPNTQDQNQPFDMTNLPVEEKLVMGTLKLEGTDQAVTAEQAKMLLTLWKAVKSMSSDSNTSSEEMEALYTQIQESMTPEQVQAIKDMSITMEDTQALMQQYGVEMRGPDLNGEPLGNLSEDERATRIAEFQSQRGDAEGGGFPGGGFPGGGIPEGGIPGGGRAEGGFPGGNGQIPMDAQGTPIAPQGGRGFRGGANLILIDSLIEMLQERANS